MSLTVQPIGGKLLSGVKSCYILVNESGALEQLSENILFYVITGLQIRGNVVVLKRGVLK